MTVWYFYPRPPRGGRQDGRRQYKSAIVISIHALREEGDLVFLKRRAWGHISIHALREEGDNYYDYVDTLRESISIHALREEGDRPEYSNNV